jgi:transposase-like protein
MGTSTFCWFANQAMTKADAARDSHRRCPGLHCDCTCHDPKEPTVPEINLAQYEEPSTTPRPHTNGDTARTRRMFTDDEKRRIATEYTEAPNGRDVLEQYQLSPSVVGNWLKKFGMANRRGREAPPEPAAASTGDQVAAALHDAAEDVEPDTDGVIGIWLEDEDLDVLDAAAFLDETDRTQLVVGLVNEAIGAYKAEADVKRLVALRRARRTDVS